MRFRAAFVGSTNPLKVRTFVEVARRFEFLADAREFLKDSGRGNVFPVNVPSCVPAQPVGLVQMFSGAGNRAIGAAGCDLARGKRDTIGVGIESGIFFLECDVAQAFDACACVITRDGRVIGRAMSAAFPVPQELLVEMLASSLEMVDAAVKLGWCDRKAGQRDGGVLGDAVTRGRMGRRHQIEQACLLALSQVERELS